MAKVDYLRTDFTGGGANDLDGIDGATLNDGDRGQVITATYGTFFYVLDASIGGTEQSPLLIAPDANPGSKRWVLLNIQGGRSGLVNLLGNSGFGVWSNSDTNKGLSRATPTENVSVDSGSTLPVVGETLTGATSGAVGKVISITDVNSQWGAGTGTGTLSLGACTGRFQDNEDLDGSTAGANCCTLNMPPTAACVDEVRNGDFTVDEDPPQGWTASNATLTTEAGGDVGNCMKVLDGGAGNGYGYQSITTVVGKLYAFSCYAKDIDTGQNGLIEIGTAAGNDTYYSSGAITADAGATYTATLEATTTTTVITLNCTTAGGTYYFDSVFLYEITPCCTAANSLGPDEWAKSIGGIHIYREHSGSNTKDGAFYALKAVSLLANKTVYIGNASLEPWLAEMAGRIITYGMWVKTSIASHARVYTYDSVTGYTFGSYHSGGGSYEWLEVTTTVAAASTNTYAGVRGAQSSGIIYISQPMLIFGSSIGEGNYVQMPGEVVHVDAIRIRIVDNESPLAADDKIRNLEALSEGMIPKGCRGVFLHASVEDSAVGSGDGIYFGTEAIARDLALWPAVNDMKTVGSGLVRCDPNGDIYQTVSVGGNTLSSLTVDVLGVKLS